MKTIKLMNQRARIVGLQHLLEKVRRLNEPNTERIEEWKSDQPLRTVLKKQKERRQWAGRQPELIQRILQRVNIHTWPGDFKYQHKEKGWGWREGTQRFRLEKVRTRKRTRDSKAHQIRRLTHIEPKYFKKSEQPSRENQIPEQNDIPRLAEQRICKKEYRKPTMLKKKNPREVNWD